MDSYLIMPKNIKVGFQNRNDTYTNKLAYITYEDNTGNLKKKKSWEGWKDDNIPVEEYENVPTEGFVLNKNVGGYKTDWSFRQSYIRVYDPRGFEFEISLENLLYILNNCICTPGKGLDGEFVYVWDNTELILLPTKGPDYKKVCEYNKKLETQEKINHKNLKVGTTYLAKNKVSYIYLGKYDWYDEKTIFERDSWRKELSKTVRYVFAENPRSYDIEKGEIEFYCRAMAQITVNTSIIGVISEEVPEYMDLMLKEINKSEHISPIDYENIQFEDLSFEIFEDMASNHKAIFFYENGVLMFSRDSDVLTDRTICYYKEYNFEAYSGWTNKNNMKRKEYSNLHDAYEKLNPKIGILSLKNGNLYHNTSKSDSENFFIYGK